MSHSEPSAAVIQPGAVLGVLGSGQLGRMFAMAARHMGYRVHVLSPKAGSPTGCVSDREFVADYTDPAAIREFIASVDAITFEFENIPPACLDLLTADDGTPTVPVRPGGHVLRTTQNRMREKTFLRSHDIPVTPFLPIRSADELQTATETSAFPAVLKTAAWGYDGKGQVRVDAATDLPAAWDSLDRTDCVLEEFVPFTGEFSVVGVRGSDGSIALYDPIWNDHANHILDVSISPAGLSETAHADAHRIAREILTALNVVGVLCVEFFLAENDRLLVNELAPRPHNSGHLTIDGHASSQFEQQVRALCGLPLGSVRQLRPAAMVNLLGQRWDAGEPNWTAALTLPETKLHLYDKGEPRTDRKMGHLTVTADTPDEARNRAIEARDALGN